MPAVDMTDAEIGELLTILNGIPEADLSDNMASLKAKCQDIMSSAKKQPVPPA